MVYAQPGVRHGKWDAETSMRFWDINWSPNLGQTTRPGDSQQKKKKKRKKRTSRIVDFAVLADHMVKLKESEKKHKYLNLARGLKNYGTRKWGWYQFWLVRLVQSPKDWYSDWRCPWCNGYRRRNWTRWHEFKSWPRLIAFHIALIPLGKVWIQLFSLQLWVNSRAD